MQEVTFTLQTVTPLFLAGANLENAELRAPAFRGVMRYWYRALVGGVATNTERLTAVVKQEANIFGTTDMGSAVTVRVSTDQVRVLVFNRTGTREKGTGKDYLLWSMERFAEKPKRRYFPQHTQFHLTLSSRDSSGDNLKQAITAIWLLTHLGGIGSRSRRCAGSIMVHTVKGNKTELQFDEQPTITALQTHLQEGLEVARNIHTIKTDVVKSASFDVLAHATCRIWILHDNGKSWHTSDEVMNVIGTKLQEYRRNILPIWKRKIFGLPLKGVSNQRFASPLLLRVTKLQGEQYVGVAVLFKTMLDSVNMSDYGLIEQWIKQDFPDALEVRL